MASGHCAPAAATRVTTRSRSARNANSRCDPPERAGTISLATRNWNVPKTGNWGPSPVSGGLSRCCPRPDRLPSLAAGPVRVVQIPQRVWILLIRSTAPFLRSSVAGSWVSFSASASVSATKNIVVGPPDVSIAS